MDAQIQTRRASTTKYRSDFVDNGQLRPFNLHGVWDTGLLPHVLKPDGSGRGEIAAMVDAYGELWREPDERVWVLAHFQQNCSRGFVSENAPIQPLIGRIPGGKPLHTFPECGLESNLWAWGRAQWPLPVPLTCGAPPRETVDLDQAYVDQAAPVVRQRLAQAATRLVQELEAALGRP